MAVVVPTDRELQALKVLWQLGQATVREITAAINERGDELAYTTVLSLLQVMEQKGLVGHEATGKVYSYFPRVQREAVLGRLAKGFWTACSTVRWTSTWSTPSNRNGCRPPDLARLEQLIEQAKQTTRRKGGKEGSK